MTNLKQQSLLLQLTRIVNLRLRFSKRWGAVSVESDNETVSVMWSLPKGIVWEYHRKEYPIKDLSKYVRSQKMKLRNEFKNRHNPGDLRP